MALLYNLLIGFSNGFSKKNRIFFRDGIGDGIGDTIEACIASFFGDTIGDGIGDTIEACIASFFGDTIGDGIGDGILKKNPRPFVLRGKE